MGRLKELRGYIDRNFVIILILLVIGITSEKREVVPDEQSTKTIQEANMDESNGDALKGGRQECIEFGRGDTPSFLWEYACNAYAESVKGELDLSTDYKGIIPTGLVTKLENVLYQQLDWDMHVNNQKLSETLYFQILAEMGTDGYKIAEEELYQWFPSLEEAKKWRDLIGRFHYSDKEGNEWVVLQWDNGGSNGACTVKVYRIEGEVPVEISVFETRYHGFAEVISYEESFYYVYLLINESIRTWDTICVHRLGENSKEENVQIKYMPQEFIWKKMYYLYGEGELSDYIEEIEKIIEVEGYIEMGEEYGGKIMPCADEVEAEEFEPQDGIPYYKIDFTNTGKPFYLTKKAHYPDRMHWYLDIGWYVPDGITGTLTEIDTIDAKEGRAGVLVQLWFKEIEDKIYTFRLFHVGDYNYLLNVVLVEGNEVKTVRDDITAPRREFVLIEGKVYHDT